MHAVKVIGSASRPPSIPRVGCYASQQWAEKMASEYLNKRYRRPTTSQAQTTDETLFNIEKARLRRMADVLPMLSRSHLIMLSY